jgi:hypothetical protein
LRLDDGDSSVGSTVNFCLRAVPGSGKRAAVESDSQVRVINDLTVENSCRGRNVLT